MPIKHALWNVGKSPFPLASCKLPSGTPRGHDRHRSDHPLRRMDVDRPTGKHALRRSCRSLGNCDRRFARVDRAQAQSNSARIVAQAIDYASWVADLSADKIAQVFQRFNDGGNLSDAFRERFGEPLDEETFNESHQIVLVAAELDDASERIVNYLNVRASRSTSLFPSLPARRRSNS